MWLGYRTAVCFSFQTSWDTCWVHTASLSQEANKNGVRVDSYLSSQIIFIFRGGKYLKESSSPTFRQIIDYFSNFKDVTLISDNLSSNFSKAITRIRMEIRILASYFFEIVISTNIVAPVLNLIVL